MHMCILCLLWFLLLTGQVPILDTVRLIRCGSQSRTPVGLVVGVVTFKPYDPAFAFEGKDMRRDAIQKPSVVTDHYGAPGKIIESIFECPQRVHIQVVG